MMCPDGLAWCVFETSIAMLGIVGIAAMMGLFELFDKDKK